MNNKITSPEIIRIAIDGNEANVKNQVGSNVYAYEILVALEKLTRTTKISKNLPEVHFDILLRDHPSSELPKERKGWRYHVFGPQKLWTQWALPNYLFKNRKKLDVLFSPGHYAPSLSPIPYVSSVMDTAYLDYPDFFNKKDLYQLTTWTKRAVKNAKKVIVISESTKEAVALHYQRKQADLVVAYPAFSQAKDTLSRGEEQRYFKKLGIQKPYFLFVGTLQPRKNIVRMIETFELLSQREPAANLQLVLAGKIGWLADEILQKIENSPLKSQIILAGFISEKEKGTLYKHALGSILVGLLEGFGIPPLESLSWGVPPVVSNNSSLPEVVGEAGYRADPFDVESIAKQMQKVLHLNTRDRGEFRKKARPQLSKFSWDKSASVILKSLLTVALSNK